MVHGTEGDVPERPRDVAEKTSTVFVNGTVVGSAMPSTSTTGQLSGMSSNMGRTSAQTLTYDSIRIGLVPPAWPGVF